MKTIYQTHSKATYLYALSKLLERMSYYGIRLFIYVADEIVQMSRQEALVPQEVNLYQNNI